MMTNLYFINQIEWAFRQDNVKAALRTAFAAIARYAEEPEYQQGYAQFKAFMAVVHKYKSSLPMDVDAGFDAFISITQNIEAVVEESEKFDVQLRIILHKDGHLFADERVGADMPIDFENITPGAYQILLETGRLLWEGEISEKLLLWDFSFPDQELDLAADTDEILFRPSKKFRLLNGRLVVEIYPGIESGKIRISRIAE